MSVWKNLYWHYFRIFCYANFNFNAFNTDLIFAWQFGPGSFLSVVYKNQLQQDEQIIQTSYFDNVQSVFESGQRNTLTLKVVYFLDAVSTFKKLRQR